jgi:hypothetical protein
MSGAAQPVPAGWYRDPGSPAQFRWWNGEAWTERTSNEQVPSPSSAKETTVTKPRSWTYPIRLRPLPRIRVTNFIGTILIVTAGGTGVWGGFAVGFVVHRGWIISALGTPFALYGLVLLFTASRLELILTSDHATVRGYTRTVRISRDSIRQITDYPMIVWSDPGGAVHRTLVNALSLYRSGRASPSPKVLALVSKQWDVLREWAARTD